AGAQSPAPRRRAPERPRLLRDGGDREAVPGPQARAADGRGEGRGADAPARQGWEAGVRGEPGGPGRGEGLESAHRREDALGDPGVHRIYADESESVVLGSGAAAG